MNAILKKLVMGVAILILGISTSWAQGSADPKLANLLAQGGTEPKPANSFAALETILVTCQKSSYPGGMSCSYPVGLGVYYTSSTLDEYLIYGLGCSATTASVYSCRVNGLNGMVMFWMFTSTQDVSTVLYVPWDTGY